MPLITYNHYAYMKLFYLLNCLNFKYDLMQTTELKSKLIDKINKIEDKNLLMEATRLIDIEIPIDEEKFIFSDMQKAKIMNSLKEIESGKYLTSDDANNEIEEWLKK